MIFRNHISVDYLKHILRHLLPKPVAYGSYLRALFQNEIELRLLSCLCDLKQTSIDVGAFHGMYATGLCGHSKNVIAIEPQHRWAEALCRSMPRNVRVMEMALSNISGSGLLKMPSMDGSGISRLDSLPFMTEGWLEVPVQLKRMDDIDHGRVGFVKIDVEGHEIEVLEGAAEIIASDRPTFLIEAEERYRAGAVTQIGEMLQKFDYAGYFVCRTEICSIHEFDPDKHQNPSLLGDGKRSAYPDYINNFIFVPRERAATLPHRVPSAWSAVYNTVRGWYLNRHLMRTPVFSQPTPADRAQHPVQSLNPRDAREPCPTEPEKST